MDNITKLLNQVKNKTILFVFPHPDDESFAVAGLIQTAKSYGYKIILLTLTQGGAGKISINPMGKSLKEVRTKELENASMILGIDKLIIKDFDDGKLKIRNGWNKSVRDVIKDINPGVIVTYDHSGVTGHPDHINVSVGINKIIKNIYLKQKPVLLWVTFAEGGYRRYINESVRSYLTEPDFELIMKIPYIISKIRAMFCHQSQRYEHLMLIIAGMIIYRKEWYHKVNLNRKYPYKYINYKI